MKQSSLSLSKFYKTKSIENFKTFKIFAINSSFIVCNSEISKQTSHCHFVSLSLSSSLFSLSASVCLFRSFNIFLCLSRLCTLLFKHDQIHFFLSFFFFSICYLSSFLSLCAHCSPSHAFFPLLSFFLFLIVFLFLEITEQVFITVLNFSFYPFLFSLSFLLFPIFQLESTSSF